jgi:LysR family transcriptional regulator, hydrogen peroxide-inducible genes activator
MLKPTADMNFTPHPVTLRQLQYVVAVAERKSFRKAAEDCRVAQPSLSAQVAQVEEALGLQLFERDTRKVTLTAAGRRLVEQATTLLTAADQLHECARSLADPLAGSLSIGIIPTLGPYLLPEVAPALRAAFPRVHFVWSENKTAVLVQQLKDAELDAAIVALESDLGGLPSVVLGKDPFVFAANPEHPLAQSDQPIRLAQLEGQAVLVLDDGHCFRDQALSFCARVGAEEASYRATSLATLVQMVAGGAGVTVLPALAVPIENRHRALTIRAFTPKQPARTIALVWRKSAAREETLKALGKALKQTYSELSPV